MDAGLAALLGALGGAAVGSLGSMGTAWLSGRTATHQAAEIAVAQQAQIRRQHRFEHLRERREPRSKAYSEFLSQGEEIQRGLSDFQSWNTPTSEALGAYGQAIGEVRRRGTRVTVEGPASILGPTRNVETMAMECFMAAIGMQTAAPRADDPAGWAASSERVLAAGRNLSEALQGFLEAVRATLDDYGDDSDRSRPTS